MPKHLLSFFAGCAVTLTLPATAQPIDISSGSVAEAVERLKAGQYVWAPEIAPSGPMLLIVNVATQRATLFRNGVPIGASTVSTGRAGRETPTGVFTVLQKQVQHHSSKYDNAPMPFMQRLTWQGVALHAGNLPGYPASHGCIRLPLGFAKLLYTQTSLGMTVVITDEQVIPRVAPTPEILTHGMDEPAASSGFSWNPAKSPRGPVSILVSAADKQAIVLRNGVVIGTASVTVDGEVTSTWAYALRSVDADGQHWVRMNLSRAPDQEQVPHSEWGRFHAPDAFKQAVAAIIGPGTTVIVTSDSVLAAAGRKMTVIEAEPR